MFIHIKLGIDNLQVDAVVNLHFNVVLMSKGCKAKTLKILTGPKPERIKTYNPTYTTGSHIDSKARSLVLYTFTFWNDYT